MADFDWPNLVPGDCEENARRLAHASGGAAHRIVPTELPDVPPEFQPRVLGRSVNNPAGDWDHHEVVVVDDRVYDEFTGAEGLPSAEYKEQFDERDQLDFGF